MEVEVADLIPDGWRHWANSDEAALERGLVAEKFAADLPEWIKAMRTDAGRNLGLARVVARRKPESALDAVGRLDQCL